MIKKLTSNLVFWLILIVFCLLSSFLVAEFGSSGIVLILGLIIVFIVFSKILKNPFWGLLVLIFFLPFERIPTIDIASFTVKINHILGIMTLISWLLLILVKKRKFEPNFLIWPLTIFLTVLFASVLYSSYPPRSIIIFIFVCFTVLLSILVVNLATNKIQLEKIIIVFFWSALIVCLFGFFQFFGDIIELPQSLTGLKEGYTKAIFGFPRIQAFSIEPLYLGNFLFIPLGIFICLFLRKIQVAFLSRFWQFVIITLMLIILILTVSRGAYFGFAVMLATIFLFYARYWFSRKVIATIIIVLVIAASGVFYFLSQGSETALDKFTHHATLGDFMTSESTEGRLIEFDKALDYWRDNPTIGIGLGAYGIVKKNFPALENMPDWDIVNNQYIELLAETGTLGFLAFVTIIITLIWRSIIAFYKSQDPLLRSVLVGLLAAFIATIVQYNFFSTLYIIHIWVLIGLIVAVQNLIFKESSIEKK